MKSKLLLAAALCAMAFTANAQTEKGKNFINGSVGFSSTEKSFRDDNVNSLVNYLDKTKAFNIMPRFGHFISNNLALGLGIGYVHGKSNTDRDEITSTSSINRVYQTSKQSSINFSPFIRYYVDVAEKFKFFSQITTSIGFGKGEQSLSQSFFSGTQIFNNSSEGDWKFTTYGAEINPGFAFFPSKRWAIEFSFPLIKYAKTKPNDQGTNTITIGSSEDFSFATDSFNPNIGFTFHF